MSKLNKYWESVDFENDVLVYWQNGNIYDCVLQCIPNTVCIINMENKTPSLCLVTITITNMCIIRW